MCGHCNITIVIVVIAAAAAAAIESSKSIQYCWMPHTKVAHDYSA